MATDKIREVDVYLQLARKRNTNGSTYGDEISIVSCTTRPPGRRAPSTVLVKIKVRVPDKGFDPAAIPALVADISLDLLHPPQDQIVLEIEDANPKGDA